MTNSNPPQPPTCECGKPSMYGKLCRDCHEDWCRREQRTILDKDIEMVKKRIIVRENRAYGTMRKYYG